MAMVKTFRIHPIHGLPDKDIRVWLSLIEEKMVVNVAVTYIPAIGESDPRLNVIVTKLDDLHGPSPIPLNDDDDNDLELSRGIPVSAGIIGR